MGLRNIKVQDFHAVIEAIKRETNTTSESVWKRIEIRPELSFRFPLRDISSFKFNPQDNKHEMEVTFLGLYGVSSPLPAHYTRHLLETYDPDKEELRISRDFLDLLNKVIYEKFYLIEDKKYFGVKYWKEHKSWGQIFKSLSGDITKNEEFCDLYLLDILSHKVKSKYYMERLLRRVLDKDQINVLENFESLYYIKDFELNSLGKKCSILDQDLYLGRKKQLRNSKIAIEITMTDTQEIEKYITHDNKCGENLDLVIKYTDSYLIDSLDYVVIINIMGNILSHTKLGLKGHKLGINSVAGKAIKNKNYMLKIYDSELTRS